MKAENPLHLKIFHSARELRQLENSVEVAQK